MISSAFSQGFEQLSRDNQEKLRAVCALITDELTPFLNRCLEALFPVKSIATVLGVGVGQASDLVSNVGIAADIYHCALLNEINYTLRNFTQKIIFQKGIRVDVQSIRDPLIKYLPIPTFTQPPQPPAAVAAPAPLQQPIPSDTNVPSENNTAPLNDAAVM